MEQLAPHCLVQLPHTYSLFWQAFPQHVNARQQHSSMLR